MDFAKLDAAVAALQVSDKAIEDKIDALKAGNPADQAKLDASAATVQAIADAQAAKAAS